MVRNRLLLSICLFTLVLTGGVIGYMAIEGMSPVDALYTSVIVLSTVGMGEIRAFSPNGRLFTVGLILGGVGLVGYLVSLVATVILEGQFEKILKRGGRNKMIKNLKGHVVICGSGILGKAVMEEVTAGEQPFVVVERNPDVVEALQAKGIMTVEGDATDDEILKSANIFMARGLISCLPTDMDNVFVCLTARNLNRNLQIVTKADAESSVGKLRKAGADRVISTKTIGSKRMAAALLEPTVTDFLDIVMSSGKLDLKMGDIVIRDGSGMIGKDIVTLGIRKNTGCIILAVKRGSTYRLSIDPDFDFHTGDILIALGTSAQLKRLSELAGRPIS